MSNLLGRATRRERIKNKDQAPAGSGGSPAPASFLLFPSWPLLLLPSRTFSPAEHSETRGGSAKQLYQSKGFQASPAQRKNARCSQKSCRAGDVESKQSVGVWLSRFSVTAPCSHGSPVCLLSRSWLDWSDGNFPSRHPVTQVPLGQVTTLAAT